MSQRLQPATDQTHTPKTADWQQQYAAFRIVVDIADKDDMFDDSIWPIGTDVRIDGSNQNNKMAQFLSIASYNLHESHQGKILLENIRYCFGITAAAQ